MGSMKLLLSLSLGLLVVAGLGAQAPADAAALAARVQQRYTALKDFQGDFVQTYEGGVLRTKTTERGTVSIKRPGKMRFVYTKPERKEFVSDGSPALHLPRRRQAGDRQPGAGSERRHHPGAVPGRPGRHRPRLHRRRLTPLPGPRPG